MAQVTITLKDTPQGGVEVQTDWKPSIGAPCSKAQSAALEIFNRTRKEWALTGIDVVHMNVAPAAQAGATQ